MVEQQQRCKLVPLAQLRNDIHSCHHAKELVHNEQEPQKIRHAKPRRHLNRGTQIFVRHAIHDLKGRHTIHHWIRLILSSRVNHRIRLNSLLNRVRLHHWNRAMRLCEQHVPQGEVRDVLDRQTSRHLNRQSSHQNSEKRMNHRSKQQILSIRHWIQLIRTSPLKTNLVRLAPDHLCSTKPRQRLLPKLPTFSFLYPLCSCLLITLASRNSHNSP